MIIRILIALVVAAVVGAGWMYMDRSRGAEWVVSPQQIADAKAQGKVGSEQRPCSVTFLPIRSETADFLPIKWALAGLATDGFTFAALNRRKAA
jgi:hypothetical protein